MKSSIVAFALSIVMIGTSFSSAADKDIVDTAVGAGKFKTLAAALTAADLVSTLKGDGPFTVFAPTDEAFSKLPKGTLETLLKPENKGLLTSILTYHVVAGKVPASAVVKLNGAKTVNGQRANIVVKDGTVMVDNAKVVATDIMCSNGIIHIIDSVILPETNNIPAVATKAGKFNTLLAAAKAAGLVDALSGDGPLTVFAPTDAAFAKLPKGTVETLLKSENKAKLAGILKYHVVSGRVYSEDVVKISSAKTLQGQKVTISTKGGVMVNNAKVVATDIDASNGVIHVIDSVLLPPMKAAAARRVLENAVAEGAELYNNGHHNACAKKYSAAMSQLMSETIDGVNNHHKAEMRTVITNASKEHHVGERAWILRRGINRMHAVLRQVR